MAFALPGIEDDFSAARTVQAPYWSVNLLRIAAGTTVSSLTLLIGPACQPLDDPQSCAKEVGPCRGRLLAAQLQSEGIADRRICTEYEVTSTNVLSLLCRSERRVQGSVVVYFSSRRSRPNTSRCFATAYRRHERRQVSRGKQSTAGREGILK